MGNGTSIGRVRGLGASRHGTGHWLQQRFTAAGNLILIPFLMISLALLPDHDYGTVRDWVSQPIPATALILIMINTFYHARIGVQNMMEDYVHEHGLKFGSLVLLYVLPAAGAVFGIVSVLRIVFGGE